MTVPIYTPDNTTTNLSGDEGEMNTGSIATSTSTTPRDPATLKNEVMQQGNAILGQTKEVASQAIDTAKNQVKTQIANQKDRATDTLSSAVRALEATGQRFREEDLGLVAGYADNVTDQVRQFTNYLQNKDIDDLTRDVESFARRNPAIFIGGAFLLGVAVARFLKSGTPSSDMMPRTSDALVPLRDVAPLSMPGTSRMTDDMPVSNWETGASETMPASTTASSMGQSTGSPL